MGKQTYRLLIMICLVTGVLGSLAVALLYWNNNRRTHDDISDATESDPYVVGTKYRPVDCSYDFVFTSQKTKDVCNIYGYSLASGTTITLVEGPAIDTQPSWGGQSQIVFASNRNGCHDIYIIDADGSDLKRLTRSSREDRGPKFIPGQERISFVSSRDNDHGLYVMDIDGRHVSEVPRASDMMWGYTWEPSGKRMVAVSRDHRKCRLMIRDANREDYKPLTNWMDRITDLMWSPDGSKIVFNG